MIAIKTSPRNGEVVSALLVRDDDEVMLITDGGILIRTRIAEISTQGRNTQGVRLISLKTKERLVSVSKVADVGQAPDGSDAPDTPNRPDGESSTTVH